MLYFSTLSTCYLSATKKDYSAYFLVQSLYSRPHYSFEFIYAFSYFAVAGILVFIFHTLSLCHLLYSSLSIIMLNKNVTRTNKKVNVLRWCRVAVGDTGGIEQEC